MCICHVDNLRNSQHPQIYVGAYVRVCTIISKVYTIFYLIVFQINRSKIICAIPAKQSSSNHGKLMAAHLKEVIIMFGQSMWSGFFRGYSHLHFCYDLIDIP
jgi:hypothetical protein